MKAPPKKTTKIQFPCVRCGSVLESTAGRGGERGVCPTCGHELPIPAVDPRTGIALEPQSAHGPAERTPMHAYAAAGANAPRIVLLDGGERAIVCPRCERASGMTSDRCRSCGLPFTLDGAVLAGSPSLTALDYACLACGVVAVLTMTCGVGYVPAGAAIVLGVLSLRRDGHDRRLIRRWPVYVGLGGAMIALAIGLAPPLLP